jgi:surfactin synthase thioesterase subunit
MSVTNLFFLPFAGGSKYSYRVFENNKPDSINIIPLEYPGRGSRINMPLVTDMKDLVDDLYAQVNPILGKAPYAIYGHSMGGVAAYLLARKIIRNHPNKPAHLFITGTTGPSCLERAKIQRHLLSKPDFILELKNLEGVPEEILENDELLKYFEPILRADFKATDTFVYESDEPLDIHFTVITGTKEKMEHEDILLWQNESSFTVEFIKMEGGHFFIFNHSEAILKVIQQKINN